MCEDSIYDHCARRLHSIHINMKYILVFAILLTQAFSNSIDQPENVANRWHAMLNNQHYVQGNKMRDYPNESTNNYKMHYNNVAATENNLKSLTNIQSFTSWPQNQQVVHNPSVNQPYYVTPINKPNYVLSASQFHQTPAKTYQYILPESIANRGLTPNKAPKSYPVNPHSNYMTGQNQMPNVEHNVYSHVSQFHSPTINNEDYYRHNKNLPESTNQYDYYVTHPNTGYESNTYKANNYDQHSNRMYNYVSSNAYDARRHPYLYENKYFPAASTNDQVYYMYMPQRAAHPVFDAPFVSRGINNVIGQW